MHENSQTKTYQSAQSQKPTQTPTNPLTKAEVNPRTQTSANPQTHINPEDASKTGAAVETKATSADDFPEVTASADLNSGHGKSGIRAYINLGAAVLASRNVSSF